MNPLCWTTWPLLEWGDYWSGEFDPLLAWPGMDAKGLVQRAGGRERAACGADEWRGAAAKGALGVALVWGVARCMPLEYAAGWVGMIGTVLILHFGIFHALSCFWRRRGIEARRLMNHPLQASSVSEFWGRRWNTAFRDLTYRFLFRPLTSRAGPLAGMLAGFLLSGAVHELVITVPARGGYGGPAAYFAIQGAAIAAERSGFGRKIGLGARGTGRIFTWIVLAGPVGLLFPRIFVVGVFVPFLRAIGAL